LADIDCWVRLADAWAINLPLADSMLATPRIGGYVDAMAGASNKEGARTVCWPSAVA